MVFAAPLFINIRRDGGISQKKVFIYFDPNIGSAIADV